MWKFKNKTTWGILILLGILVVLALIPTIFSLPGDGLERIATDFGFSEGSSFELGIANDYDFLGIGGIVGTALSAILSILIIIAIFLAIKVIIRKKNDASTSNS